MAANPTLLSMPIAKNGTKNTIPENQATPGNGLMSQSTGFPAECSLPLGAGGVAPDRADFNGAFNLLSGVAFYAQKGFTFNYDATQDYYAGCVVIDGGNRYLCIADMAAGTIAPNADTTNTYWTIFPFGLINKRVKITTSGTFTAPVTGWYKITAKGGGAGGVGGSYSATRVSGGYGGGEGGTTIAYEKMTAGQTATVVIGAGGTAGAAGGGAAGVGGNSTVTVNSNTYTAGGGGLTAGGTGTIPGAPGGTAQGFPISGSLTNDAAYGGSGGGAGGTTNRFAAGVSDVPTDGGGGAGGYASSYASTQTAGGVGGDGFVWFEYYDPSI